jgi:hypothetical protein
MDAGKAGSDKRTHDRTQFLSALATKYVRAIVGVIVMMYPYVFPQLILSGLNFMR